MHTGANAVTLYCISCVTHALLSTRAWRISQQGGVQKMQALSIYVQCTYVFATVCYSV